MKQICSNEVDLQQKLLDLESWLTDRGYKSEIVWPEIQKVNLNDRSNLKKRPKYQEDSITLVLTFHPALHMVFDILKRVHQHVQNSPMLKAVLPKPPRVVLCTPQFNQYKSDLKLYCEGRRGFFREKLIEHFFNHSHNGSQKDVMVQIIDFCNPNDQEKLEDFWMQKLQTLYSNGLNMKRVDQ